MNVLILAYASEPDAGSEYSVGWMVPLTMAQRYPKHQIYVLTRSRCREVIEKNLFELNLPNLHFLFYDIPNWMFYKNEMQSNWGEQINYLSWQILVKGFIKKINKEIDFDMIHHLTFNQYRTPSAGFWQKIPFVMGPIGGAECIAPAFWQDLEPHTVKKEKIRQKGYDLKIFRWFNSRSNNKKMILCSSAENLSRLKPYAGKSNMAKMPAIAFSPKDFESTYTRDKIVNDNVFTMIYAGKAWDWKGIHIFLKAAKKAYIDNNISDFKIKLIGIRFKEEQDRVLSWVDELGLKKYVELISFMQRNELLKMEVQSNLSVYPAFRDSGSMSILEACALGVTSICFDAGGQDIFPNNILLKIPIFQTYNECLKAFAEKLNWAYHNREQLKEIGFSAQKWVLENLTWEKKVDEIVAIYEDILKNKICPYEH